ncbi:MAG: ABC transporter permease [Chloroflexi bacterium]|nr:ABC transporter permease [Chloroflexota bacterium]
MRKTWAVMKKEFRHMLRDPRSLALVTLGAMLILSIMAYNFSRDIAQVPTVVLDYDRTAHSQAYRDAFRADRFFALSASADNPVQVEDLLRGSLATVGIIIPRGFASDLDVGKAAPVQILVDGSDPNSAAQAVGHARAISARFGLGILKEAMHRQRGQITAMMEPALDVRTQILYNPGTKTVNGMVPGLMGIVLAIPALTTALSIAREKESGTLELLMATPLGRTQLLAGKLVPYVVVGLVDVLLLTAVGRWGFGVPFDGSLLLLLFLSSIFLWANLSIGLLIATAVETQAAAIMLAFMIFVIPPFFLSGLFLPISGMPVWLQSEAYTLPATHFVTIARAIFLKSAGLDMLWENALYLAVVATALGTVATLRFRKRIA